MSIAYNNGIHPKHDIIKYKEWFKNINSNDVVLDIGSMGSLPKFLSEKAINVYGIEIEKRHYAKSKNLKVIT